MLAAEVLLTHRWHSARLPNRACRFLSASLSQTNRDERHHLDPPLLVPLSLDRFSEYWEHPGEYGLEVHGARDFYGYLYTGDAPTAGDLAYSFDYTYADGRDPREYQRELADAIATWRENSHADFRSLRYYKGPGFLTLVDYRSGIGPAKYVLDGLKGDIYLACDAASTAAAVAHRVDAWKDDVSTDDVHEFLDELVRERLMYEESFRYLALAIAAQIHAPACTDKPGIIDGTD